MSSRVHTVVLCVITTFNPAPTSVLLCIVVTMWFCATLRTIRVYCTVQIVCSYVMLGAHCVARAEFLQAHVLFRAIFPPFFNCNITVCVCIVRAGQRMSGT